MVMEKNTIKNKKTTSNAAGRSGQKRAAKQPPGGSVEVTVPVEHSLKVFPSHIFRAYRPEVYIFRLPCSLVRPT